MSECTKTSFINEKYALEYIDWLKRTSKQGKKIPQKAYLCVKCNTWHLTSQKVLASELSKNDIDILIVDNENLLKKNIIRGKQIFILNERIKSLKQEIIDLQNKLNDQESK